MEERNGASETQCTVSRALAFSKFAAGGVSGEELSGFWYAFIVGGDDEAPMLVM